MDSKIWPKEVQLNHIIKKRLSENYPNLWAMMQGAVSGSHTEWPLMRQELVHLMEAYEFEVTQAYLEGGNEPD